MKIGINTIEPITLTTLRLGLAAIFLVAWQLIKRNPFHFSQKITFICFFIGLVGNALPFSMICWGEQYIDSGLAAALMGIMPVATAFLAHLFIRDEPFTLRIGLGIIVGFGGLILLVGSEALLGITSSFIAQVAIILSAICYGVSTIFTRYNSGVSPNINLATGATFAGFIWLLPIAFIFEDPLSTAPDMAGIISIIYLAIGPTALAAVIFFYIIPRLGVNTFAMVNYLIPLLGITWGVFFLNEEPSLKLLGSLGCVLTAMFIIRKRI